MRDESNDAAHKSEQFSSPKSAADFFAGVDEARAHLSRSGSQADETLQRLQVIAANLLKRRQPDDQRRWLEEEIQAALGATRCEIFLTGRGEQTTLTATILSQLQKTPPSLYDTTSQLLSASGPSGRVSVGDLTIFSVMGASGVNGVVALKVPSVTWSWDGILELFGAILSTAGLWFEKNDVGGAIVPVVDYDQGHED